MKKWLLGIILFVVVTSALFYGYQILHKVEISSLESIVPEEVICYLSSYNLDEKIKNFQSSSFFKQIASSSVYKKLVGPQLDKVKQRIPFLPDFFKKDVAFAVFSLGNIESRRKNFVEYGDFLFLARLDPKSHANIRKSVTDFYLSCVSKDNQTSCKKYKGIKITTYRLPRINAEISYVLLSDVILISNNISIVQKSIDLFRNTNQNSLLNNKDFQKITARIKKDCLVWCYGDSRRYYNQEFLQAYAKKKETGESSKSIERLVKMGPFIDSVNIFEANASYIDYDRFQGGLIIKTYQSFNRAADKGNLINIIVSSKKLDQATFNLTPKNIIAYYGGNQDLPSLWQFLRKISSSIDEAAKTGANNDLRSYRYKSQINKFYVENTIKTGESFLGVGIEKDILPLLGNNFGVVWVNIEEVEIPLGGLKVSPALSQPAPVSFPMVFPQFYSFIELKDAAKMQELMQKMMQHLVEKVNQTIEDQKRILQEKNVAQKEAQDQNNEQPQTIEAKKPLELKVDNYKGIDISTIEIRDFPIAVLRFNYCVMDKYIIFSLSPQLTKKIIDLYKNKYGSFGSNLDFGFAQDKIPSDYSDIMFFSFKNMINSIRRTKFFNVLQSELLMRTQKDFSQGDLDAILDILSDIKALFATRGMLDSSTLESSCYIMIEGLE